MSKMFDALRKAEAERRKRRDADPGPQMVLPADGALARAVPDPGNPADAVVGDGLPEGLLRELGILRNSVETILKKPRRRSILFTSAGHEEGTSTLALGYARLLSEAARERVLLIEANVRRPSLAARLGLGEREGFLECVFGQCLLSAVNVPIEAAGIDVVVVGKGDAAQLQSHMEGGVPRVIEQALADWDTVILDAPPVMNSPETPQLATLVDGVIMVLQCGRTKREVVQRALDTLSKVGGKTLGIALNRKRYYIPEFIYQRI